MRLLLRKPAQSLNKAHARQSITQDRMDTFRRALTRLFARVDEHETEEHQKNSIAEFLNEAFYADQYLINTQNGIDLVVHRGPSDSEPTGVVIEARKAFAGEMMTTIKNNVRALHELILYYFEERERHQNTAISQLIITDVYNWFIFDENDFRHHFYDNPKLRKLYQIKQQQKKDNPFFYGEVAKILRDLDDVMPVTYLDLRRTADALALPMDEANQLLIPAYKLLSPVHLFKLPFVDNANTINQPFYNELLYIVGLPEGERHTGSLLEKTINLLRVDNGLADFDTPQPYGRTEAEQLFNVGLELCITWLNRILFLKLLEGQHVRYHGGDRSVQFLTARHIRDFDELNELFFEVLAVPEANRPSGIVNRYGTVPYLNSSLFERTDLERKTLKIKELKGGADLPLFADTVLKDSQGKPQAGQLPTLQYLLAFLDAYDFSPEDPAGVLTSSKPLISATGLGLIVEKLNAYRDRSFFTPGFITTPLVRDAIQKAAVSRFNERFGWQCADIMDLNNRLGEISITDANDVVNSIRIVDPAVGSGHFLVSALNELIVLKAELGILADREGRRLRHYDVSIVNNELVITDQEGELFQYIIGGTVSREKIESSTEHSRLNEMQRVQETIFHEKQTLIENCLFGVDSKLNSISICRLRLWIELLRSAYYKRNGSSLITHHLVALPNLEINLKVGNALVSRFATTFRTDTVRNQSTRETFLSDFHRYRVDMQAYKHVRDKPKKDRIRARIRHFWEMVEQIALLDLKEYAQLKQIEAKVAQASQTFDFFVEDRRLQTLNDLFDTRQQVFAEKQRVFSQAFEWRFEFPDVLDEAGRYVGFDVVLGRPPSVRPEELGDYKAQFRKAFPNTYTGKADLYVLFIEQGLNLLRPGGQLAYILPNKWMRAGYGAKLRQWLKTKTIEEITDLGDSAEYGKTTMNLSILVVRNTDVTSP